MKKMLFVMIFVFLCIAVIAKAQQVVNPCIPVTTNGITRCVPIGTSNPLLSVSH